MFLIKRDTGDLRGVFWEKSNADVDGSVVESSFYFICISLEEADGNARIFLVKNLQNGWQKYLCPDMGTSYCQGSADEPADIDQFLL